MSPTLLTQRLAFVAGKTAVRKAISTPVFHPFIGTPAVLHGCAAARKQQQRRQKRTAGAGAGQQHSSSQQQQQQEEQQQITALPQQHHHKAAARGGAFRRLRLLCASTVRALPAAGIKAAVLSGVQQLSSFTAFAGLSGAVIAGLVLGVAGKGARHWHACRRGGRRPSSMARAEGSNSSSQAAATEVSILSFNIRGVMDRWPERAPVLRRVLKQADADVVCFQEVLTGEFRQEQLLLGSSYQVHECRAALQHLRCKTNLLGTALSSVLSSLLGVSWFRSLLVSLPESVEGWRERNKLAGGWARLLRDLAIVPFYGNSIATRVPATSTVTVSSSTTAGGSSSTVPAISSSSLCWPPAWCSNGATSSSGNTALAGGSSSSKSGTAAAAAAVTTAGGGDILVLGDFRAAQRVCLKLKLSPPKPQQLATAAPGGAKTQEQYSRQELQELIQQQMQGFEPDNNISSSGSIQTQQQQQQQVVAGGEKSDVVDVWLVNTHLDHASPEIRARQMQAICSWVEPLKASAAAIVVTGDLNAPPDEELHVVAGRNRFASSHKVVHGSEPPFTWPSGIIAPLMDEGDPHCADYIYVWQAQGHELQVLNAQLCGDRPTESDSTLYPSDHIGLKVTLRISKTAGSAATAAAGGVAAASGGGADGGARESAGGSSSK